MNDRRIMVSNEFYDYITNLKFETNEQGKSYPVLSEDWKKRHKKELKRGSYKIRLFG